MGLKDCQITLDNPWNSYYPGQTINGTVEYTFDAPKKVRGVCIKFKGEAATSWGETGMRKDAQGKASNTTITYSGEEEYFTISYYLVGSKSGNEMELPQGKHTYPFTCALPPTLPSSFEGEHGFVRYTIKSTLDRPWKFDQDTKMAFTVVSHLDLNSNPQYRMPLQIQLEKNFCCCWCKSGPLIVDVNLPVTGYCSGQVIPLDISCENGSNVSINEIIIQMRKIVNFRAQLPTPKTKEETIVIAELKLGVVGANASKNWKETMQIPPLPPSNLTNCGIIDLDYEIKVTCSPSGIHMDMDDKKNIILGTVPIAGFDAMPPGGAPVPVQGQGEGYGQPGAEVPLLPSAPMNPNPGLAPDPNQPAIMPIGASTLYPQLAQPTFQEGQFSARTIHDADDHQNMIINGRSDFTPRYPTYGGYPQQ